MWDNQRALWRYRSLVEWTWNPLSHSDDENLRWCWLRAVEWVAWPGFVSQLFAPLLLLAWHPLLVLGFLATANFAWATVRERFVSVKLSSVAALAVVFGKWPVCIGTGIYFIAYGRFGYAALSLGYPLLCAFVPSVSGEIGALQRQFMAKLGYVLADRPDAGAGEFLRESFLPRGDCGPESELSRRIDNWLSADGTRRPKQCELANVFFKALGMPAAACGEMIQQCVLRAWTDSAKSFGSLLAEQTELELRRHQVAVSDAEFRRYRRFLTFLDRPAARAA